MSDTGRLSDVTALMARRLRCPTCLRRFRTQDIVTLESSARFGVFRLHCPMCHIDRLVMAVWSKNGVQTYATDLDAQEWFYYRNAPAIDADDVIRISRMLQEYDAGFADVLEDPFLDPDDQPQERP